MSPKSVALNAPRFPIDLDAWRTWQASHRPLLQRVRSLKSSAPPTGVVTMGSPQADILVVVDADTPSLTRAVVQPIRFIDPRRVAVLAFNARPDLAGPATTVNSVLNSSDIRSTIPNLNTCVSVGSHLPLGDIAHRAIREIDGHSYVVQHGLLTTYAPPLPPDSTLLAWSDADADFWRAGRDDIETCTVGSQLLWDAAETDTAPVDTDIPPVFLGQMHAAELPRSVSFRASSTFCRKHGATYRPHPAEVDRTSKLAHRLMRAQGIQFDTDLAPLASTRRPVVAVFSSGILEAAAAGIPSWSYLENPPGWVAEFWDRYTISRWGSGPTRAPKRPDIPPAEQIAQIVATNGPCR